MFSGIKYLLLRSSRTLYSQSPRRTHSDSLTMSLTILARPLSRDLMALLGSSGHTPFSTEGFQIRLSTIELLLPQATFTTLPIGPLHKHYSIPLSART